MDAWQDSRPSFETRPSKSAVADFDTLGCRSRASPTSVGAPQGEVRVSGTDRQIPKPRHVAHLKVRFAKHFLHHPELHPPFRFRKVRLIANEFADAGLDDGFGALHAWKPWHIHDAALKRHADPGGVVDCVALGVGTPQVLGPGLAAMPCLDVVAHAARKTVETGRSDLLVRPDNDGADPATFFLAPAGDLMRQQHEPLIPGARKHC